MAKELPRRIDPSSTLPLLADRFRRGSQTDSCAALVMLGHLDGARPMRWAGHLRTSVRYALVLTIMLGSSLPSWSHNAPTVSFPPMETAPSECQALQPWFPEAQCTSAWMPEAPLTIVLFALLVIAVAHGLRRWRRTAALSLVLAVSTFTFGTAVHAVHHLSAPGKAAECLVFSASQHVSGTLDEPCDIRAPGVSVTSAFLANPEVPTYILRCGADLPRAPPSLLS